MVLRWCRCCCCRLPLDKASNFIGCTFGILSALSLSRSIITLVAIGGDGAEYDERGRAVTLLIWQSCSNAATVLFCGLLVLGVRRRSPALVMSFVVYWALMQTLATGLVLYSLYDTSALVSEYDLREVRDEHGDETAQLFTYIAVGLLLPLVGFFWYLWLVVVSFYRELTDGRAASGGAASGAQTASWADREAGFGQQMV